MWTRGRTMRGPVLATVVAAVFAWGCAPQPVQVPSAPAALPHSFEPPPAAAERPEMRTRPSAGVEAPDAFPEQVYRRAAAQGAPIFRVDSAKSTVVVEVRRAGSLGRLGHDHVVASHDLRGYVDPGARRADLYVRLDELVVDEPALRKDAGFDTDPSPEAIAGTRHNMLDRTLDAGRYPFAMIGVRMVHTSLSPREWGGDSGRAHAPENIDVTIVLHGEKRTFRVPVQMTRDSEYIDVAGEIAFKQTDFGIVPLSILGGAIAVQDEVRLRFRILSQRLRKDRDPAL